MTIYRTFKYLDKALEVTVATPPTPTPIAADTDAPGASVLTIAALDLHPAVIAPGALVTLTAQISGAAVAYVYVELLLHDADAGLAYGPLYRAHLRAPREKTLGGLVRPDWDAHFSITCQFQPQLGLLTDGVNDAFGCMMPEQYGVETGGRIEGRYQTADGAAYTATLTLGSDGSVRKLLAAKSKPGAMRRSGPREVAPRSGDQFIPRLQVFALPEMASSATGESNPLACHPTALRWSATAPFPGAYLVGVAVQDLDGNYTRQYLPLTVAAPDDAPESLPPMDGEWQDE